MLSVVFALLLVTGCGERRDLPKLFDRVERLLPSHPDSARTLLNSVLQPDELGDKWLAHWCMLQGQIADSLYSELPFSKYMERANDYYRANGSPREQARIGLYLGRAYVQEKAYEKATIAYVDALETAKQAKDYNQAGYISSYMGDLYDFEDDYPSGKAKFLQAERYFRQAGNLRSAALALRDAGRMCAFADSAEVALPYLFQADAIINEVGDSSDIASVLNAIGNTYNYLGKTDSAVYYLKKSICVSDVGKGNNYAALANVYIISGKYDEALYCLEQAAKLGDSDELKTVIIYRYYQIEKAKGNYEEALSYMDRFYEISDSIKALQNKENVFETEKRYNTIGIVSDNILLRKKNILLFIGIVFLIALILFVLYIYQRRIAWRNKKISSQKEKIAQKENKIVTLQEGFQDKERELFEKKRIITELESLNLIRKKNEQAIQYIETTHQEMKEYQRKLLLSSKLVIKMMNLSKIVKPGQKMPPISPIEWKKYEDLVNEIYPRFENQLSRYEMIPLERKYCYLNILQLGREGEAILSNLAKDTIKKYRQQLRKTFGIPGREHNLDEFIQNML